MNRMFVLATLISLQAHAKDGPPLTIATPRTFAQKCGNALTFSPLVATDVGEVVFADKVDGKIVAQVSTRISSDGLSLIKPSFTHYKGSRGNAHLLEQLFAINPDFQDVDLTLDKDDLAIFNQTRGSSHAKVRATSAYKEFAAHGFTNIFIESVADSEVQIVLSKRGMLWRILRW